MSRVAIARTRLFRVRVLGGEELGVDVENGVQIEAAQIQHLFQRHLTEVDLLDRRARVHSHNPLAQRSQFLRVDEIGLRQQDAVGEADLVLGLDLGIQRLVAVLGVNDRDHAVEQVVRRDVLLDEERLRHGTGIGHVDALTRQQHRIAESSARAQQPFIPDRILLP